MTLFVILVLVLVGMVALLRLVSPTLAGLSIGTMIIGGGIAIFNASLGWMIVKLGIFAAIVLFAIGIISLFRE